MRQRIAATTLRITKQFEESGRTRRRPLSPTRNRPIGANSQWDDSPQAACGYMNFDNRSRLIQPSARVSHRKAIASRWVSDIPNAPSGHPAGKSQPLALSHGPVPPQRSGAVARDAPLRAASRAYRPASRARRPCIGGRSGNPGKSPQRC